MAWLDDPRKADAYEAVIRGQVIPRIEAKRIPGFRHIVLTRSELDDEVEFITTMWFDDFDSIKPLPDMRDQPVVPTSAGDSKDRVAEALQMLRQYPNPPVSSLRLINMLASPMTPHSDARPTPPSKLPPRRSCSLRRTSALLDRIFAGGRPTDPSYAGTMAYACAEGVYPIDRLAEPDVRREQWLERNEAWPVVDELAAKYIGAAYPRDQERVVALVDVDHAGSFNPR